MKLLHNAQTLISTIEKKAVDIKESEGLNSVKSKIEENKVS